MRNLFIGSFLIFGVQNAWSASCMDFTGKYKCANGAKIELRQTDCNVLDIKDTNPNGQTIDITWITDGVAHYEEPGMHSRVTWTSFHSNDGIHHFVGAYDAYSKTTTTYRRHLSKDANHLLEVYYLKAKDDLTTDEHRIKCTR